MTGRDQPGAVPSAALLSSVRVVELSRSVAAAYCGRLFAQLGATVHRHGPPTEVTATEAAQEPLRASLHAGKSSVPDTDALEALLQAADIVIVDAPGPDAEIAAALARLRRQGASDGRPILLDISNAADAAGVLPATGLTSGAWAGMSWAIGEVGRAPLSLPYDIAEYELGVSAAAAALVALVGGLPGAEVDVSGRDVLAYFVGMLVPNYLPYGRPWRREGRRPSMSGGVYPCGLFPCSDGHVAIYCRSDREWRGVVKAMGEPEWSRDPRFADPKAVARLHADEADGHLLPWLAARSREELLEIGRQFDFPVAPVRRIDEVMADEQFAHRGSLRPLAVPGRTSPVRVPDAPWRLSAVQEAGAAGRRRADAGPPAEERTPSSLLGGLRVLDLSWVWSGPMVTSILADHGAEVIKIEHPSRLDSLRLRGRALKDGREIEGPDGEVNPWFNQLNHGKKSAIVDIKSEEGREQILSLAASCDIVVENMRPGALDRLGIGYADLALRNPSLVMLSMSMAGQAGPLSQMKGYAGIMSAMAGLEALVGYAGEASDETVGMTMTALGDPNAALHAVTVLMAALHRRRATGKGLWIDLAQTDAVLAIMNGPLIEWQVAGSVPILENRHPVHVPHGHFPCAGEDSWAAIAIVSERHWQGLAELAGAALAPFAALDATGRSRARAAIERALRGWTSGQDRDRLVAALLRRGIPAAPVASFEETDASPWKRARGLTHPIRHPYLGRQEVFLPPWIINGQKAVVDRPAPLLGADTPAVRDELARNAMR